MKSILKPSRPVKLPPVNGRTANQKPLTAAQIERMLRADGFRPTDLVTKRRLAQHGCLGMPAE